jgi:hypothetical protein
MTTKFLALISIIGIAALCVAQAQSPTPAGSPTESPSPAKKHRVSKKAAATASPSAAGSAVSASPVAKGGRKTKTTAVAPSAVSPSPSPAKKTLADFFKPKTSPSPATGVAPGAKGATTAGAVAKTTPAPGGGHGLVWVNTETRVYHKEGSRFYGKTKKGKYVSEADAIKEGDKPAKRE